jgi:hypothetical protein
VKLPEISARPPGMASLTDGAEMATPSKTMAKRFCGSLFCEIARVACWKQSHLRVPGHHPVDVVLRNARDSRRQLVPLDQGRPEQVLLGFLPVTGEHALVGDLGDLGLTRELSECCLAGLSWLPVQRLVGRNSLAVG